MEWVSHIDLISRKSAVPRVPALRRHRGCPPPKVAPAYASVKGCCSKRPSHPTPTFWHPVRAPSRLDEIHARPERSQVGKIHTRIELVDSRFQDGCLDSLGVCGAFAKHRGQLMADNL